VTKDGNSSDVMVDLTSGVNVIEILHP
jgi:hypothetical protein